MNSSVQRINKSNFKAIITNGTQKENIYLVHYYEPNDGKSYQFTKEFQNMAEKLKGIITLAFVNCKENSQLCKEEVKDPLPRIILYPPFPYGKESYDLDISQVVNRGLKHVQNYAKSQTDQSYLSFIKTETQLPKVLFFNETERVPVYI